MSTSRLTRTTLCAITIAMLGACSQAPAQQTTVPSAPSTAAGIPATADCAAKSPALSINTSPSGKYVQGTISGDATCLPTGQSVWVLVLRDGVFYKVGNDPIRLDGSGHFSISNPPLVPSPTHRPVVIRFYAMNGSQSAQLRGLPGSFPANDLPKGSQQLNGIIAAI